MRGNSMTTLAGGTREPRAWKLASVVRGGAVGKGLCYSTSLAAYSTLAARAWIAWISWATASCGPHASERPRVLGHGRRAKPRPPRRTHSPRAPRERGVVL